MSAPSKSPRPKQRTLVAAEPNAVEDDDPKPATELLPDLQSALAAAEAKADKANAARAEAREAVEAADRALVEAEAQAVQSMVDAARVGDTDESRRGIAEAKQALAGARDKADWSRLQDAAMEIALSEAVEASGRAQRAVTMAEYVIEAETFSDPQCREKVLLAQLTSTVAELLPLIVSRRNTHNRLAQEYSACPAEDRPKLPEGRQHLYRHDGNVGSWHWGSVQFFDISIARAIEAGFDRGAETAALSWGSQPRVPN